MAAGCNSPVEEFTVTLPDVAEVDGGAAIVTDPRELTLLPEVNVIAPDGVKSVLPPVTVNVPPVPPIVLPAVTTEGWTGPVMVPNVPLPEVNVTAPEFGVVGASGNCAGCPSGAKAMADPQRGTVTTSVLPVGPLSMVKFPATFKGP